MVLLNEVLHSRGESLNLSLEGNWARFVSLNVLGGCHRASKYNTTLGPGSDHMAFRLLRIAQNEFPHRQHQLMMPKKSLVSHTVFAYSKQHLHNKKRRPRREHQCGASQIPFESQVRTFHNSKVLEQGKLCVPWFVRLLGLFIVVNG